MWWSGFKLSGPDIRSSTATPRRFAGGVGTGASTGKPKQASHTPTSPANTTSLPDAGSGEGKSPTPGTSAGVQGVTPTGGVAAVSPAAVASPASMGDGSGSGLPRSGEGQSCSRTVAVECCVLCVLCCVVLFFLFVLLFSPLLVLVLCWLLILLHFVARLCTTPPVLHVARLWSRKASAASLQSQAHVVPGFQTKSHGRVRSRRPGEAHVCVGHAGRRPL